MSEIELEGLPGATMRASCSPKVEWMGTDSRPASFSASPKPNWTFAFPPPLRVWQCAQFTWR